MQNDATFNAKQKIVVDYFVWNNLLMYFHIQDQREKLELYLSKLYAEQIRTIIEVSLKKLNVSGYTHRET